MCVLYYKEKDQNCSASTTMLCNCLISDKTGVIRNECFLYCSIYLHCSICRFFCNWQLAKPQILSKHSFLQMVNTPLLKFLAVRTKNIKRQGVWMMVLDITKCQRQSQSNTWDVWFTAAAWPSQRVGGGFNWLWVEMNNKVHSCRVKTSLCLWRSELSPRSKSCLTWKSCGMVKSYSVKSGVCRLF